MSSISVSTSSKVVVLRKGKRKKPSTAQAGIGDRGFDEEEHEFDMSESSSSEGELTTPGMHDSLAQPSTSRMLSGSTNFSSYRPKPGFLPSMQPNNLPQQSMAPSFGRPPQPPYIAAPGPSNVQTNAPGVQDPSRPEPTLVGSAADDEDDEYDDEEDEELTFSDTEENIRHKLDQTREQMKLVLQNFTPEQMHRYEKFRRVGFSRHVVKKIMFNVLGHSINPNTVIVMSGVAKVFVGELVEEAKDVMEDWNESGPLLPSHLMEAHRRLKSRYNLIPHCSKYRNRRIL